MPTGPGESTRFNAAVTPLGGVRADFVANLGRRLAELRQHWASFEQDPSTSRARDEVRRRIHALTTRARLLEFVVMADRLDEAQRKLDRSGAAGTLDSADSGWFHDLFSTLPSLAWNDVVPEQPLPVPAYEPAPSAPAEPAQAPQPPSLTSVLVVGGEPLARALTEPGSALSARELECERTEDMSVALDLARAVAPDLVVVDIDLEGAAGFIAALSEDPLTEPVPVLVVGTWSQPEQATDLLSLGIVRCLAKPVSPDLLRSAAEQAATAAARNVVDLTPMGELTVDEVADRLIAQLRAGLIQAVRPDARHFKIQVGQGSELLAAVWSAVARVRETLTIQSHGNVRFSSTGPAGAVPIAPWMDESRLEPPPRRTAGRERDDQLDKVRLEGRRVLVVDDDPAITWFLSGILRSSGALVYEAHNGRRALELAFRSTPDLVITDIIMPELDGFGLCRELKRDIALRDVPVILLSWKEDLLQRVRELGARADGYLKKESSAPTILRRVQEVLQPRMRIEARLRAGGEVRGRLDGLTARTLLQLVGSAMPEARLTIRDARYVYELELREGAPRAATRTAQDGSFERGEAVLAAMLGLAAGRFYIIPSSAPLRATLQGDLSKQLNPLIARVRAAQRLLSGDALLGVRSLKLSLDALTLDSMPMQARVAFEQLHGGMSPRELILSRGESPAMLEALLDDAAIHGAVEAIAGDDGAELLEAETSRLLETMNAPVRPARSVRTGEGPRASAPAAQAAATEPVASQPLAAELAPAPKTLPGTPAPPPVEEKQAPLATLAAAPIEPAPPARAEPAARRKLPRSWNDDDPGAPTSLTEAVIREVLDPEERNLPSPPPPAPMLDARELKPRSMRSASAQIPSLPPDAIVPAPDAPVELAGTAEPSVPAMPSLPPTWPTELASGAPLTGQRPEELARPTPEPKTRTWVSGKAPPVQPLEDPGPAPQGNPGKGSALGTVLLAMVTLAGLIAAGVWLKSPITLERAAEQATSSTAATAPAPISALVSASAASPDGLAAVSAQPSASAPVSSASAAPAELAPEEEDDWEDDQPLPQGARVPAGSGLLEIRTQSRDAVVLIGGKEAGSGLVVTSVRPAGRHTILVRWTGREVAREVLVRADRWTRISVVPPS